MIRPGQRLALPVDFVQQLLGRLHLRRARQRFVHHFFGFRFRILELQQHRHRLVRDALDGWRRFDGRRSGGLIFDEAKLAHFPLQFGDDFFRALLTDAGQRLEERHIAQVDRARDG